MMNNSVKLESVNLRLKLFWSSPGVSKSDFSDIRVNPRFSGVPDTMMDFV